MSNKKEWKDAKVTLLQNYLLDNFAVLLKFERSEENRSMVNPTIEKRRPSLAILRKKTDA